MLTDSQIRSAKRGERPQIREAFVGAVRETLALTVERGIELPQAAQERSSAMSGPAGAQRRNMHIRE